MSVEIQEWFENYQQQLRDEGRKLGLQEGLVHGLARLFEKRLSRRLTERERATLAERLARLGEDRLEEVVLALSGEALGAWLADPTAR